MSDDDLTEARSRERGAFPSTVEATLERGPREHEGKRGPEKGGEAEDWIMAEDRRLVNQLARAVQRADG